MIKIITVYQSLNPGSFFQATALFNVIKEKYSDTTFYNTRSRHPLLSGAKLSLKLLIKREYSLSLKQMMMAFAYRKMLFAFAQSSKYEKEDIIVLGSDEIWNVSREDVSKYPIFWGTGLNQEKCIAYAPSINNATVDDLNKYPYVLQALDNLKKISVRDKHSKNEIEKLTTREVQLVCDPVMLFPVSYYREKYHKKHYDKKYILIYGPKRHFEDDNVFKIRNFAKENGYKVYSYYFYHSWVDEVFYGDPYCFLELIDSADIVFTSTFHGTIFSIMYNKDFLVFGENKKVQEVLELFDLKMRLCFDGSIETLLDEEINYHLINSKLNELSRQSKEYLYMSINEIQN